MTIPTKSARFKVAAKPRVTFAFESVYLSALAALGANADGYQFLERAAIAARAKLCGLTAAQIQHVLECAEYRHESSVTEEQWQVVYECLQAQ